MTARAAAPRLTVDIVVAAPGWRGTRPAATVRAALKAAALRHLDRPASVTVLLTDDDGQRDLNRRFRGQNKPTNVLSFPAGAPSGVEPAPLGDISVALETTAREADEAGRPLADHLTHLVVHGFLHLIGYDHLEPAEAERMEAAERAVLATLGLPDPYRDHDLIAS